MTNADGSKLDWFNQHVDRVVGKVGHWWIWLTTCPKCGATKRIDCTCVSGGFR